MITPSLKPPREVQRSLRQLNDDTSLGAHLDCRMPSATPSHRPQLFGRAPCELVAGDELCRAKVIVKQNHSLEKRCRSGVSKTPK